MFFGEGFPGGFPGGMGGMGGGRGPVDNNKFYNLLGVDKNCTDKELKSAYRKLAMKHHPDKGGDTEKFQEISHAFEVLSDPQKRQIYDQAGEEGLEGQGMGGAGDASDIFDMFFGGGGRSRGPRGPPKTESVQSRIDVTLEQLYKGMSKSLAVNKDSLCRSCDGVGGPKELIVTCSGCDGQGFKVKIVRMGPMISQSRAPCDQCGQEGRYIPPKYQCKTCNGKKVCKERKILTVDIEPGCKDKKQIVFEGEADAKPGHEPGDVIVVVNEKPHDRFKRSEDDLIIEESIDLYDLICGMHLDVVALDGRKLVIEVKPGAIKTNSMPIVTVHNEGMPKSGNPHVRGNLQIKFNINFPQGAPADKHLGQLQELLGTIPGCKGRGKPRFNIDDDEVEICRGLSYITTQSNRRRADDSDEEGYGQGGHGQGVQCQTH